MPVFLRWLRGVMKLTTKGVSKAALPSTYLMILIMTHAQESAVRAVVRDTWLKLSSKGPSVVRYVFALGTQNLSASTQQYLEDEQKLYGDLLLLSSLRDTYANLTRKTLMSIDTLCQNYRFEFLLKRDIPELLLAVTSLLEPEDFRALMTMQFFGEDLVRKRRLAGFCSPTVFRVDSDSFVRLGAFIQDLRTVAHPRLYWGFLDGRARPRRKGQWAEKEWVLCDRYLPYQLGGGYVISYALADFISRNKNLLKLYKNEDVSVGAWIAGLNVKYVHDPRFDTEFKSRGCNNEYIVTHKQSPEALERLFSTLKNSGKLCESEYRVRPSYVYDWSVPPSMCCVRENGTSIP